MIVIILGPDSGLAHRTLKRVLKDRDPSGQSTSYIDGTTQGIRAVINDVSSVGFFSAGRVVVVDGLINRLGKQGSKDGGNPPDWKALYESVPEASTLVLVDAGVAELPSLAKKPLPKTAIVEFSKPPRGPKLIDWIVRTAESAGGSMDKATAQHLAMSMFPAGWGSEPRNPQYDKPPDMEQLENEINKLVLAAHPHAVTRETVDIMVPREEQDQIFNFLDAAAAGNVPVAMQEMEKLLAVGEDAAKLLNQLMGNIEIASVVAAAGRRPPDDIGKDIALANPRRVQSIQRGLQGMSPGVAQQRSQIARDSDYKLKHGEVKDPLDALYDAILQIAHMRRLAAIRR